eukprot:758823-Hanusia_phi.AAC.6
MANMWKVDARGSMSPTRPYASASSGGKYRYMSTCRPIVKESPGGQLCKRRCRPTVHPCMANSGQGK